MGSKQNIVSKKGFRLKPLPTEFDDLLKPTYNFSVS